VPAETANGPEHAEEHLLGEIKRFFAIAQEIHRQLDDHPLMLGDELGAGAFFAHCAPLHKRRLADADFRPTDCPGLLH
jgi:hypothetical protein